MDMNSHDLTGDLDAVAKRLRDDRPRITELELDRAKRRAISQAAPVAMMKPRIAVAFVLAIGLLTGGTGATLAVISESGSAAEVQYPELQPKESINPGVLGSERSGAAQVQEEQQVATGGSELPFTGFLAIPLLVAGVAFLVTGGVLRSRSSGDKTG
jgi:hypothetical protein